MTDTKSLILGYTEDIHYVVLIVNHNVLILLIKWKEKIGKSFKFRKWSHTIWTFLDIIQRTISYSILITANRNVLILLTGERRKSENHLIFTNTSHHFHEEMYSGERKSLLCLEDSDPHLPKQNGPHLMYAINITSFLSFQMVKPVKNTLKGNFLLILFFLFGLKEIRKSFWCYRKDLLT